MLDQRFWSKVDKSGECWNWTGGLIRDGYPFHNINRKKVMAHRLAFIDANGEIPAGLFVCHRCDNRRCVRPSHLFLGTHDDNMRDMVEKGRAARGERSFRSKLTTADVVRIKERLRSGETPRAIAPDYSVGVTAIHNIRSGLCWRHVS